MGDHLQIMGIERWSLRSALVNPVSDFQQISASGYALGEQALMIADVLTPQQQQLMLAIVKAMQQPFKSVDLTDSQIKHYKLVIFLGQEIAQPLQKPVALGEWINREEQQVLVTHGLQAMLDNKALKAETWKHLRAVMAVLKSFI